MSAPLATPRIRAPRTARLGEVVEIRTLMEHPMETGLRQEGGRSIPRDMLSRMTIRMNGEPLLEADLRNGTATNPFHVFFLRVERHAELEFIWTDEAGRTARAAHRITVA
ncbi:thiosulfate oxidation carrier complex protein SoxZ [Sediminicoccus sp. KRV36]|uniref:thiosulfate oxidation carrier complex protein SoxZ n=1 Tax=Sediminicoccus sp. KRV36 TaxID=3133721 RepID=UPI00200D242B|nr:thiosulfate oxidation carrier complex protein SoxZ [Sediminicoccus rosea]UPY37372.1 thiosulfate oxidation carrier complex protein SoxZ [Sediminicoccus rosea]